MMPFALVRVIVSKVGAILGFDSSATDDDLAAWTPGDTFRGLLYQVGVGVDAGPYLSSVALAMVEYPCLYFYGGPSLSVIQAGDIGAMLGDGADCSGSYLCMAVAAGLCTPEFAAANRTSASIANACAAIPVGQQRPGDCACYDGHVAMVLTDPDEDGHSWVLSMSGGGRTTFGDDPDARAKIVRADYRSDFLGYGRLPNME